MNQNRIFTQKMKNYKYQIIWFVLSVILFFHQFTMYNHIVKLESDSKNIVSAIIHKKLCRMNGASKLTIHYNQKTYFMTINRKNCWKYNIQDTIKLVYDKNNDMLLRTNESTSYWRKSQGLFISIILSLIPWNKLKLTNTD